MRLQKPRPHDSPSAHNRERQQEVSKEAGLRENKDQAEAYWCAAVSLQSFPDHGSPGEGLRMQLGATVYDEGYIFYGAYKHIYTYIYIYIHTLIYIYIYIIRTLQGSIGVSGAEGFQPSKMVNQAVPQVLARLYREADAKKNEHHHDRFQT